LALDASKVAPGIEELDHIQERIFHSLHVRKIIGILKSTLYFMDKTGWVCSLGLKNLLHATHYTRHFFIPLTWHVGDTLVISVLSKTAVAFARGEDLIVFHGFLEFEEKVLLEEDSKTALVPEWVSG
jgi:hypothetical protein